MFNQLVHSRLPASILGDFPSSLVSIPSPGCRETLWEYIFLISFPSTTLQILLERFYNFPAPGPQKMDHRQYNHLYQSAWLKMAPPLPYSVALPKKKKKKRNESTLPVNRIRSKGYRARKTQTMWYTWRF